MAMETLLFLGQVPYLFGLFLFIQIWYFVYNHFCPFLDRIPHLKHLNPRRACVKFGLHLVPLTEFLAWQGSRNCHKKGDHGEDSPDDPDELELPDWSYYKDFFITLYRVVPWRFTSRLWGQVNDKNLPETLRRPLLGLYVWLFGCDVTEALVEDLTHYKNLQDFFKRQLKPEVRPIDQQHALVSPCDGKVLHFGEVKDCMLEQVKGVTYCLKTFLGPNNWYANDDSEDPNPSFSVNKITDNEYLESLNIKEGNKLYHCIIYLAPGDYHRFHSPTDWSAAHRRHFPGELFSVNPGIASWIKGLFNLNERVVITGQWQYGFFSMAAVGATNVGSINIYFDEELNTNVKGAYTSGAFHDKSLRKPDPESKSPEKVDVSLNKGAGIGEFNLGSTIVLIFEAPKDFNFNVEQGEKVKFGERLGSI